MTQRLIATVPDVNGFTEKYYWDDDRPEYDKMHIVRIQNVEGVINANKEAISNIHNQKSGFGNNGMYHAARIPLAQLEKWKSEEGFDWFNSTESEKKQKMNDPKYAHYRTRRSTV